MISATVRIADAVTGNVPGAILGRRQNERTGHHEPAPRSPARTTVSRLARSLLDIRNVTLSFGGVKAITNISFDVRKGEIRAIIGPNGAGKTSMLNVINGFYTPQEGKITFRGKERKSMKPARGGRSGHCPHLPERGAVQGHVDARQHHDRALDAA